MIAVIPAAGLGTRLLPLTKSVPKELLPVGNRPAIQRVLAEVYRAGITQVVIVTSSRKPALRDFLRLTSTSDARRNRDAVEELERLLHSLQITFVEQPEPHGLRDAVWQCKAIVGSESFALVMPDNVPATAELLATMLEKRAAAGHSCVALYSDAHSPRHLKASSFVIVVDPIKSGISRIIKVIPGPQVDVRVPWRIGIGRTIFAPGSIELFAPEEGSVNVVDNSEVSVLNALAKQQSLLGIESREDIWHIGSIEAYVAAFEYFARNDVRDHGTSRSSQQSF